MTDKLVNQDSTEKKHKTGNKVDNHILYVTIADQLTDHCMTVARLVLKFNVVQLSKKVDICKLICE